MFVTSQPTQAESSKTHKKESKKNKRQADERAISATITEENTVKKKKTKQTYDDRDRNLEVSSEKAEDRRLKEKILSDTEPREAQDDAMEEIPSKHAEEKEHKRKHKKDAKHAKKSIHETQNDEAVASTTAKEKKKKRKRAEAEQDAERESKEDGEEPAMKKKKHRNKTGFPDPEEDESLSEQSRKALGYVFLQLHRPKKWKFSKARQNWIIRNMWSAQAIPDIYHPIALQYLSRVQGGVRENLIETCRSIIEEKKPVPAPDSHFSAVGGVLVQSDTNVQATDVKASRAKILLAALTAQPAPTVES